MSDREDMYDRRTTLRQYVHQRVVPMTTLGRQTISPTAKALPKTYSEAAEKSSIERRYAELSAEWDQLQQLSGDELAALAEADFRHTVANLRAKIETLARRILACVRLIALAHNIDDVTLVDIKSITLSRLNSDLMDMTNKSSIASQILADTVLRSGESWKSQRQAYLAREMDQQVERLNAACGRETANNQMLTALHQIKT